MHPAFSVIFLTTLIGAGQGLFLALYTGQFLSAIRLLPAQEPVAFHAIGSAISLLLLLAGLAGSFLHLGRPERAWRTAASWRTSWLSREVIALPACMAAIAAWGLIHYFGQDSALASITGSLEVPLSLLVGAIATLLCLALFLCTGMIYACIRMLQEWATPLTVVNYFLLGGASGFVLATAFAAWQAPALAGFYGAGALALTALAFVTRSASLIRNARLRHKSTLQTAIGIRHARIEQKSQGAMGGSFNTREFFHGASQRKFALVKWLFLVLVFPVPALLLWVGLAMPSPVLLLSAFLVQYLGLLAERWFFFAQANHPQNLYYQTV